MGEINQALGTAGDGITIQALGKDWKFLPPSQKAYGKFESLLERRAIRKLKERRANIPTDEFTDDDYEFEYGQILKQISSFAFSWGTPISSQAMGTIEGNAEFGAILLQQAHPSVSTQTARAIMYEDPKSYAMTINALISSGEGGLPNVQAGTALREP